MKYVVDRKEDNNIILEDINSKKKVVLKDDNFLDNLKEGDILNKDFLVDKENTYKRKKNIKDRFNKLKQKKDIH